MPQAVLPDAEQLVAQLRADPNLDYTKIAAQYGVSRQAVSKRIHKAGVIPPKPKPVSLRDYVPWRVLAKHDSHLHVRMLRLYGRRDLGLPIPDGRRKNLEDWEASLRYLKLVVTYDRETVAGFGVDEKRAGDKELWRP